MSKVLRKISMVLMTAILSLVPASRALAATGDIIDPSLKGSVTIHKYDLTAAEMNGVDTSAFLRDGKENTEAEEALKNYVIKGVEFTYVRTGDISTETAAGKIRLLYEIPSKLESILQLTDSRGDHKYTSDELNTALGSLLESDNSGGKNLLETYIQQAEDAVPMSLTDDAGITSAADLTCGLYLFVETKVPANVTYTTDPFFVSIPMTDQEGDNWFYDLDIYPKNQTGIPDLDKLVRQHDDADKLSYSDVATASEGDIVDFIYVSHLPKIASESTYLTQYTFEDKMDPGLTYNQDVSVYFYDSKEAARDNLTEQAIKTWTSDSGYYEVTFQNTGSEYRTMKLTLTKEGLKDINASFSEKYLVVSYSSTVNSDASAVLGDTGNDNDVKLTWKRSSMDYIDTLEDRARVYTYGLNVKKTFSQKQNNKQGDPAKVQFTLKNKTDGHYITAVTKNNSGIYYITDSSKGDGEDQATAFTPSSDGSLIINGLEADTYILTEIRTDSGYSLLKDPVTVVIQSTQDSIIPSKTTLYDTAAISNNTNKELIDTEGTRAAATVDGKEASMSADSTVDSLNARVDMDILNTSAFLLPQTGGFGTLLFTLAGCAAAFWGVTILTKKEKKDK